MHNIFLGRTGDKNPSSISNKSIKFILHDNGPIRVLKSLKVRFRHGWFGGSVKVKALSRLGNTYLRSSDHGERRGRNDGILRLRFSSKRGEWIRGSRDFIFRRIKWSRSSVFNLDLRRGSEIGFVWRRVRHKVITRGGRDRTQIIKKGIRRWVFRSHGIKGKAIFFEYNMERNNDFASGKIETTISSVIGWGNWGIKWVGLRSKFMWGRKVGVT